MNSDHKAARVMAECVRASLLDVVRLIREADFSGQTGPEAAASIARSVEKGAELAYQQITVEIDAEAADATA